LSSIIKSNDSEFKNVEQFFDEGVFYPRLDQRSQEIQESKKEAMRIIQEAEQQAIAHVEKFKQAGIDEAVKRLSPLTTVLSSIIADLRHYKNATAAQLEPVVTDLAIQIARKIVKDEVAANPTIIKRNVMHALATIVDKEQVVLELNPQDRDLMEKYQKTVMASFRDIKGVTIESNDTVERGGCYVRTLRGEIDATIDTQFREIAKAFNKDVPLGDD
jgi:flagellar assembly protein FliH